LLLGASPMQNQPFIGPAGTCNDVADSTVLLHGHRGDFELTTVPQDAQGDFAAVAIQGSFADGIRGESLPLRTVFQ